MPETSLHTVPAKAFMQHGSSTSNQMGASSGKSQMDGEQENDRGLFALGEVVPDLEEGNCVDVYMIRHGERIDETPEGQEWMRNNR
jgi:hypothetical protein